MQLQRLVTTGALPCSKEEAASLAAIQLRLQECLPSIKLPSSKFLSHQSCHNNSSNPNQNNNQVGPLFIFYFPFWICCWPVSFLANARPSLFFLFLANGSTVSCFVTRLSDTCSRKLQQDWPVPGQKRLQPEEAPSCFIFRPAEAAAAAAARTTSALASLSSSPPPPPPVSRRVRPASARAMICSSTRPAI